MNIENIQQDYEDGFNCDTQVSFHDNILEIFIDNRTSVVIENIDSSTACVLADKLLHIWDFSYCLEFESEEDFMEFFS